MDMPLMVSKGAKNLIRFSVVIAFRVQSTHLFPENS